MILSACIIAKSASEELTRAVASVRPHVDEVVLVWTGGESEERPSTFEGVDAASHFTECNSEHACSGPCGCQPGDILDFAAARNHALSRAHGDWSTWIDSDDVVVKTAAKSLRQVAHEASGPVLMPYAYCPDDGFFVPRLIPKGKTWVYPIHEFIPPPYAARSDRSFTWQHVRTRERAVQSTLRNERILLHWREHPALQDDPRMLYFQGRSKVDLGKRVAAIRPLAKAFSLERSPERRATVAMLLSRCFPPGLPGSDREAWAWEAVKAAPSWSKPWENLAVILPKMVQAFTHVAKTLGPTPLESLAPFARPKAS